MWEDSQQVPGPEKVHLDLEFEMGSPLSSLAKEPLP